MGLVYGMVIGILLSLGAGVVWSWLRRRGSDRTGDIEPAIRMRDDLLVIFLTLAAFGLGVFLTYALLSIRM